jgi:hypothetical protein
MYRYKKSLDKEKNWHIHFIFITMIPNTYICSLSFYSSFSFFVNKLGNNRPVAAFFEINNAFHTGIFSLEILYFSSHNFLHGFVRLKARL